MSLAGNLAGAVAGVASGGGASIPTAALGDTIIEYWMSDRGIGFVSGEVEEWVGQHAGTVLTAPAAENRLLFVEEDANFNGHPSLQCRKSDSERYLVASGLSGLITAGDKVWVGVVVRSQGFVAGGFNYLLYFQITGVDDYCFIVLTGAGDARFRLNSTGNIDNNVLGIDETDPALWRMHWKTNETDAAVGSSSNTASGSGVDASPGDIDIIRLGTASGGDWDVCALTLALDPSPEQIAAYAAAEAARYGVQV